MSLLPPPLVLHRLPPPPAGSGPDAAGEATSHNPNLMPFSIDYTGPANVDGYLVPHTREAGASGPSSEPEVYTHFRGRRLFHAALPLPQDWEGATFFLYRDRTSQDFGVTGGDDAAASLEAGVEPLSANAKAGEATERGATFFHGQDQAEREELLRRKKRKRLHLGQSTKGNEKPHPAVTDCSSRAANGKGVKPAKATTMAAFSMDEDDEDEQQDPYEADVDAELVHGDDCDVAEEPQEHFTEDDEALSIASGDEAMPGEDQHLNDASVPEVKALQPQRVPPTRVTALAPRPYSRFSEINLWGPDGKLDMGDEELVKVFGEWQSVNALLHTT